MIIQFSPKTQSAANPAGTDDNRSRKQTVVFPFFTPAKAPDGTIRYSKSGYASRISGCAGFGGRPDPWDGGDAA